MDIKSASFIKSAPQVELCPENNGKEYAFIGRSNVGKSSLINMLVGQKQLAKTSQTPGKTLLINHFLVNNDWQIVDLPGYGYARRDKQQREQLKKMIDGYILGRHQMTNLFLLIDSRHEPMQIDLDFINWLGENGIPFSIVFTKMDKQSALAGNRNIKAYKEKLLESWDQLPPIFLTSSSTGQGKTELLDYIDTLNKA